MAFSFTKSRLWYSCIDYSMSTNDDSLCRMNFLHQRKSRDLVDLRFRSPPLVTSTFRSVSSRYAAIALITDNSLLYSALAYLVRELRVFSRGFATVVTNSCDGGCTRMTAVWGRRSKKSSPELVKPCKSSIMARYYR